MATQEPGRISLAALPTPMARLERLEAELGRGSIWMKRDDLTGLELTGNKVRKLEYVLAQALADGCDTIVTEGTGQSNHCRATAAACARLGLRAVLLLRPEPPDEPQGNHLLDVLFGAETRSCSSEQFKQCRKEIVETVLAELRDAGHTPRWVPMGASEPIGCWGYIRAIAELAEQLRAADLETCDVIMAVSSGGTYAGALLGTLLHKLDGLHVWGVPVSDDIPFHRRNIGDLCRRTVEQFNLPIAFSDSTIRLIDGYVGEGYGIPYPAAIESIRRLARTESIVLDPVYTAKAFCALLDGVRDGRFGHERPVVFVHTGGVFSTLAYPNVLLDRVD